MNIILNERAYAETAIQNHTLSSKPVETLSRVAKYFYSQGYSKGEISRMLEAFLLKCDPSINIVKWQDTIARQVRESEKFPLIELESIPITRQEIELCGSLSGKQARRILFTLIALARFANTVNPQNSGWVNRQDREIFRLANVVTSIKRQSLLLNDLRALGLIHFSKKVDNINIHVNCLDNTEEPALHIFDFRNLGYQYLRFCGEPYFECSICGLVTRRANNSQKYCSSCAVEINRQKALENWRQSAL